MVLDGRVPEPVVILSNCEYCSPCSSHLTVVILYGKQALKCCVKIVFHTLPKEMLD